MPIPVKIEFPNNSISKHPVRKLALKAVLLKLDKNNASMSCRPYDGASEENVYVLMIKIKTGLNSSSSQCFLKEKESMFSVFL